MAVDVDKYIFWDQDNKYFFNEHILILPDISIGNVGQLAVDLLLNNLDVKHLGRIVHPCFLPFIGSDPFHLGSTRLTTSCEIYECQKKKLVIVQIRSRVFPSQVQEFKNLIMQFAQKLKFKQMVVTSSSSSEYFSAEQLKDVPLHYLCTSKFLHLEKFKQLNWREFSFPDNVDASIIPPIPGSFITHALLETCERENIPLAVLICVCSEGNNYPEALQVVDCLNLWLNFKETQEKKSVEVWKIPVSWKLPYGSAAPHTIY